MCVNCSSNSQKEIENGKAKEVKYYWGNLEEDIWECIEAFF